jgi:WD40 repeat protein
LTFLEKEVSSDEEMGRVVIWELNPKNKDIKECVKVLTCTKMVNRAIFAPGNENFVYGALSSGQIVVWDLREKSRPFNHSKPSLQGHNLPIYCLENITDGRRDLLMSISNEGKLCIWNPETLGEPDIIETLTFKPENKATSTRTEKEADSQPLAPITSLIHPGNGPKDAKVFLSTLDKLVKTYDVNDFITKQEEKESKVFTGHHAPICSMALNRTDNVVFAGLLLTGSFDFSIKLWKPDTSE